MFDKFRSKLANALVQKTKAGVPNTVLGNTLMGVSNFNPPKRGTQELLDLYSESPWIRAVVNKVGRAIGDTTWRLYVPKDVNTGKARFDPSFSRISKNKRDSRISKALDINAISEITNHPLLSLLEAGNEAMTGKAVIQLIGQHIDLCGESFLVLERNSLGVPIALWPVPPSWVRRTPNAVHNFYTLHGIYGAGASSSNIDVPASEMIYIKDPDPANPYGRGSGITKALADEIEIDEYACHDNTTECLTKRGWVYGPDLTYDDEIATWNEVTQKTEFYKPNEIIRKEFNGEMHHWTGRSVDVFVTPNHRLWIEKSGCFDTKNNKYYNGNKHEPWHFETSEELLNSPSKNFHWRTTGSYSGNIDTINIPGVERITKRKENSRGGGRPPKFGVNDPLSFKTVDFAKFLGYYISEGSSDRAALCIGQSECKFEDDVRDCFTIFPKEWCKETVAQPKYLNSSPAHKFYVYHLGLTEWVRIHVGDGAYNKKLPEEVFEWSLEAKLKLLEGLLNGDGSYHENGSGASYFSASERLADDVQRLCIDVGWGTYKTSSINHTTLMHQIHVCRKRTFQHIQRNKTKAVLIPFCGQVWCVSVENEKFFTRRNGCVMIGGNSKHLKSFFYNRAKPDLIISGDNIGRDDTVRLEEKWLEKHQGFMNAFKPLFMSRKVDIKELSQNMEQQQMVQLREQERNTILQTYGVSPEVMGIVGDSKRSTIALADMFFSKHVITPRVELIRATLQKHLVPLFDERLIIDFDSPVEEDTDLILEVMKAEPAAFTLNDWRALAKRETLGPKGKVVLVPVNQDIIAVSDLKDPNARQSAQVGANSGDTSSAANNNGVASKKWFDTTVEQQNKEDENKKVVDTYESLIKELNAELASGKVSKVLITKIREVVKPEQGQTDEPTN